MSLHRQCVLCFVILCTLGYVMRCVASGIRTNVVSEDSDEDEKLKQALILVELLKKEYAKMLRENNALRKKETTPLVVEPTCASTNETSRSSTQSIAASPAPTPAVSTSPQQSALITVDNQLPRRRMARLPPQPFNGLTRRNGGFQPYNFFRRRIPAEYYYDYPDPRRNLRDGGEANQNIAQTDTTTEAPTETTTEAPTETTTDAKTETTTGAPTETTTDAPTKAPTETPSTNNGEATAASETETEPPEEPTVDDMANEATNSKKENDPVISQVADELILEINAEKTKKTKKKPTNTGRITRLKPKYNFVLLAKPTMKIHLGGSTRIPIPLPLNHAFCYTNPKNALCRTSI